MSKFLQTINEQAPTGKMPIGSIPTGKGIKPQQPVPPKPTTPQNYQNKSSLGQIGGALRKIGSGFQKVKGAVSAVKDFTATGDLSVLQQLGQQLINRALDLDTYKISAFGKKGYTDVLLIDEELIAKIGLLTPTKKVKAESADIILQSGLLNGNKFLQVLKEAKPAVKQKPQVAIAPQFLFELTKERNLGTNGKQYTLTPKTPEVQQYLNDKGIKFVTFLRDPNNSPENIVGNVRFDDNSGKLQFYDLENQFIQSLETEVKFEYSPQDKLYKIGSSLTDRSFEDIDQTKELLKKGILLIHPREKLFRLEGPTQEGKFANFTNTQTKEQFHGLLNTYQTPDKKTNFIVMSSIKPGLKPYTQPTVSKPSTPKVVAPKKVTKPVAAPAKPATTAPNKTTP
jgi:hypothetical protein